MSTTWTLIRSDFQRLGGSVRPNPLRIMGSCVTRPGFLACVLLRVQARLVKQRHSHLANLVRTVNLALTGMDVVSGVTIGEGLEVQHPNGIVLGEGVVIGSRCTLLQQVTLGERMSREGRAAYPVVGDEVMIGAGAKVLGGVDIGHRAVVGANSVVLKDVPGGATAAGVPATIRPALQ